MFIFLGYSAVYARELLVDAEAGAPEDERAVLVVRRGRARVVARLLHHHLLRADLRRELLREPLARVDLVELDVAERVARHLLAARLHLGDDVLGARALGDE